MVQVVVMGLSAIIVSFAYQWKLSLLIFAFIPFLLFAGAMYTSINTSFAAKEKESIVKAASVGFCLMTSTPRYKLTEIDGFETPAGYH